MSELVLRAAATMISHTWHKLKAIPAHWILTHGPFPCSSLNPDIQS